MSLGQSTCKGDGEGNVVISAVTNTTLDQEPVSGLQRATAFHSLLIQLTSSFDEIAQEAHKVAVRSPALRVLLHIHPFSIYALRTYLEGLQTSNLFWVWLAGIRTRTSRIASSSPFQLEHVMWEC